MNNKILLRLVPHPTTLCLLFFLLLSTTAFAASPPPLRILLIPMRSPTSMYKDFLPLKHYLAQKMSRPIQLTVAHRNSEIAALFREKKIDVAFVCPTLYCTLTQDISLSPIVKLRLSGRDDYRSVLVVREDSDIKWTADLLGKTMVYGRYKCPGSGLLPKIMLRRVGLSEDTFFEVVKLGNDESALLSVLSRMFDVTGVPEMAARPYIGRGLRIIRYSAPIPQYLFTARTGLGVDLIAEIQSVLLALNDNPDRRDIIGSLEKGMDGFTIAHDSDYDIIRVLAESLQGKGKRPPIRPGEHTLVVEPLYFDADLFGRLKPLLGQLRRELGWNFHLRLPESIEDFMALGGSGQDILFLREGGLALDGNQSLEDLGTLSLLPADANVGLIISTADGVQTVTDLQGRKIGIPFSASEGGFLAQKRRLEELGVTLAPEQLVKLKTCEQVLMSVYHGEVAAGFITLDTLNRLGDDIDPGRLKILARTEPLSPWLLSAAAGVPDFVKKKVKKILARQ